ncbi:MAG: putative porin [Bacteroidales bacterium]
MRRLFPLIGFLFCLLVCFAHPLMGADEPGIPEVSWFTHEMVHDPYQEHPLLADTTLAGFHRYDFPYREAVFVADKGNIGHRTRRLSFVPETEPGFRLFENKWYPGYTLSASDMKFYRPEHVFTELYYVLGSENEQSFYAKHNQRFHDRVYGSFRYQVVNSPGYYSRLGARNNNVSANVDVQATDRYQILGSFFVNRVYNHESGGLKDHIGFEENEVQDSVYLYQAESRYRELGFRLHQIYQAAFEYEKDTVSDTIPEAVNPLNLGRFTHDFIYKRETFVFDEPGSPSSAFYEEEPANTHLTYDSTLVHRMDNKLAWSNYPAPESETQPSLYLNVYLRHTWIRLHQPKFTEQETDTYLFDRNSYSQLQPGLRIYSDPNRFLSFDGHARFIAGGYNAGDLGMDGRFLIGRSGDDSRLAINGAYAEQEAPYFLTRFRSNYISWDNAFKKQRTLNLGVTYLTPHITGEANYYLLNRALFMNEGGHPEQHDGSFSALTARVVAEMDVGFFGMHHVVQYQYLDVERFTSFPPLISYHSLYGDFRLFDDALHLLTGFDLRYHLPYEPMAFMPPARQFYRQDKYESDHTLLLDVFVNARISRARLFLKVENIGHFVTDASPVYDIPFYPQPETMIKFGISWMFFN